MLKKYSFVFLLSGYFVYAGEVEVFSTSSEVTRNVSRSASVTNALINITTISEVMPTADQIEAAKAKVFESIDRIDDSALQKCLRFLQENEVSLHNEGIQNLVQKFLSLVVAVPSRDPIDMIGCENKKEVLEIIKDLVLQFDLESCCRIMESLDLKYAPMDIEGCDRFFVEWVQYSEEEIVLKPVRFFSSKSNRRAYFAATIGLCLFGIAVGEFIWTLLICSMIK